MAINQPVRTRVLIIGTGFSGIGMSIKLKQAGISDFVILEKANDFGGTWRDNTYPGAACDVPAHLYSLSFEPNPDWSRWWAPGTEIQRYLLSVVDKHRLREHVVFGAKVVAAKWHEAESRWHVSTEDGGKYVAQFVVSGVGALHIPSIPAIKGRESFQGEQCHSAEWHEGMDLRGKRVAVIGTGASAIQIVPAIVDDVAELKLFQRTPAWVVPRRNNEIPKWLRRTFKWVPGTRLAARYGVHLYQEFVGSAMTHHQQLLGIIEWLGKRNIRKHVADPELRRKLTPQYRAGCKRVLAGSAFYRAVSAGKSELVTESILGITESGVVTRDQHGGETLHDVDVIIWATGFHVTDSFRYLGSIEGAGGVDLVDRWNQTGMIAHRGVTIADMPNLFFLLGPNTGLGHNSVVIMIEIQIKYALQAIQAVDKRGAGALVPTEAAQAAYNDWVQERLSHTVQNTGGCVSWYLDEFGKNRVLWPDHTGVYRRALRRFDPKEYRFSGTRD